MTPLEKLLAAIDSINVKVSALEAAATATSAATPAAPAPSTTPSPVVDSGQAALAAIEALRGEMAMDAHKLPPHVRVLLKGKSADSVNDYVSSPEYQASIKKAPAAKPEGETATPPATVEGTPAVTPLSPEATVAKAESDRLISGNFTGAELEELASLFI
jgi:hypothetical protein